MRERHDLDHLRGRRIAGAPPRRRRRHQAREHGIGSALVRGALEAARARGLKVKPRCSFVRAVIAKHPEFHDLLAPPA